MKRKHFIFFILFLAGLFTIFSFVTKTRRPAETVSAYYNDIMEHMFSRMYKSWYTPESFPDTIVKITAPGEYANEKTYNMYASSQCKSSPSYMYYAFYIPLDSNAYWNWASFSYNKKMQARYKKLFGKEIIAKRFLQKAQYGGGYGEQEFRFYSGEGIEAAFKKLYKKPVEKFKGISLQKIYNLCLKNYCRDAGDVILKVKARDTMFVRLSKKYLNDALQDSTFNGQAFTHEACNQLGFDLDLQKESCIDPYSQSRIVGIMLRRQCDGSLPVLLKWFKIILKDYDPEFYEKVKAKF